MNKQYAKILILLFGVLIVIFSLVFSIITNKNCFEVQQDGVGWQTYLDYQSRDRAPFSQLGVDALEGNFDTYYPLFNDYTLPGAIYRLFSIDSPGPTATYAIYVVAFLFVIFITARFFSIKSSPTLLALVISGFFFPPLIVHHFALIFRYFQLNPHWFQLVILSTIALLAFWALDGKWKARNYLLILVPALCVSLEIMSLGAMIIFTPAVILYGAGSLYFSRTRSELYQKILSIFLTILFVIGSGEAIYLYGLEQYSAYKYFWREFDWDLLSLNSLSLFFSAFPFGTLLIGGGIIGAVLCIFKETGRLRQLAVTHLFASGIFFGLGTGFLFWAKLHPYRGSAPFYFESIFLPYSVIFTSIAILFSIKFIAERFNRLIQNRPIKSSFVFIHIEELSVLFAILIISGFNVYEVFAKTHDFCLRDQVYDNLKSTKITDILQNTLSLAPGKPFQGIVSTIDWPDNFPAISARHMNRQNYIRWISTGNDHRIGGLWHFNIPTLYQYFTFINAPYYLLLTEFLSRPEDRQTRSGFIFTLINPGMLELWGVRYIITDQNTNVGKKVVSLPIPDRPPLRLIELPNPNLGNYSPTHMQQISDFHTGLSLMHRASFDGMDTVLTDEPIQGPLTPATDIHLIYTTYGFRLEAQSSGESIIILPAQFSRCWSIKGTGNPYIFRADLMQLGVHFSGKLHARLRFHYGPLFASKCRLEDVTDIKRLKISEGRVIKRIIPKIEPIE